MNRTAQIRTLSYSNFPIDSIHPVKTPPPYIGSYSDHHRRLLAISKAISVSRPVEEILYMVYLALQAGSPFDNWYLYIPGPISDPIKGLETTLNQKGIVPFRLMPIPQEPGPVSEVIKTGDPRLYTLERAKGSPDTTIQQNELMYPIHLGGKPYGVTSLVRKKAPGFSTEEYELALLFLSQIGLGLEKTLLHHQGLSATNALKRLLPFSRSLSQPIPTAEITEAIGKGAMALSGADRVAVYAHGPQHQVTHLWAQGITDAGLSQLINLPQGPNDHIQFSSDIQTLPEGSILRKFSESEGIRALALCPTGSPEKTTAIDCFYDSPHTWSKSDIQALEIYVRQAAVALDNIRLSDELEEATMQTVLTLARALDIRDTYTANHSRRLASWAEKTARKMNCSSEDIRRIHWAALLHDIGKIGVPDSILHKNGPLTNSEWEVMKQHPELGASIVSPLRPLRTVTPIIRSHQERFDGKGYPDGLSGDEIPLTARILTVVDAFGAMTDDRIYRKALSQEQALEELRRNAGKQFDRQIVDIFLDVIETGPSAMIQ